MAGRRLGISWTPGPGAVAGRGVEVVVAGGLLVVVGFGVGALGAFVYFLEEKKLQHPDFARGPPPHYYPSRNVLNFVDQTGCGALTIVWP